MMIKEIDRTANMAWSPASAPLPVCLAAGTAAQQLDASFSTTSSLEIYELNVQEPGLEMALRGSVATEHRFHKVSWGARASDEIGGRGVVVGGCDAGTIFVYDVARVLHGSGSGAVDSAAGGVGDAMIFRGEKHSGPVRALDFNPFQANLLASGAGESEILVWDLSSPATPMTPGTRSQPPDDVTCVAWNCQVQHILASTFGTRCVVWDLRKNEPIIKVSNSTTRMRCKVVAWHPNVATQMCLASEDDHTPFIQLWDLRFATSPLKTLENHQRGVLSLAWCPQDPDLLLSCGKDCRILVWNPNSNVVGGEVVCEIPTSNQWSFDVAWCPRNPAILSSSSFDGHISIYSLMGGIQNVKPDAKITEAFMDAGGPFQQQQQQQHQDFIQTPVFLTKPPKWCRRPVGASFGFGGKLVSFDSDWQTSHLQSAPHGATDSSAASVAAASTLVYVSQVVTEPALVQRAEQLEAVLTSGQFVEFCEKKSETAKSSEQRLVWNFLRAHYDADPRTKFLSMLGHDPADIRHSHEDCQSDGDSVPVESSDATPEVLFDNIAATDATLKSAVPIPNSSNTEGLVTRMLLVGDLSGAVDECCRSNLLVEALLLATAGGQDLLEKTQRKYFQMKKNDGLAGVISAVVTRNWSRAVNTCALDDWKEVLAGAMVYSKPEEFSRFSEILGRRLEAEGGKSRIGDAILCYVCSASVAGLVECWSRATADVSNPDELQNLIEQVTVMKRVASTRNAQQSAVANTHGSLSQVLYRYAATMASQGRLSTALLHLEPSEEESVSALQNRLSRALNVQSSAAAATVVPPQQRIQTRPVSLQQRQTPFHVEQHPTLSGQSYPVVRPQRKEVIPFSPVYPVPSQTMSPPMHSTSRGPNLYTPPLLNEPANSLYGQPRQYNTGIVGIMQPDFSHGGGGNRPSSVVPAPQPQAANTGSMYAPSTGHVPPYNPTPSYGNVPTAHYQPSQAPPPPHQSSFPPQENYGSYTPMDHIPRTGWNDPPPQVVKPIQSQQEQQQHDFERPAPITHPLYGSNDPTYNQGWMPPQQQPNYVNPEQQLQQQQIAPQAPVISRQLPPPAPKTIPTEHKILVDVFEALKARCFETSNSMPMKRKLEDVSRKLEVLYDKLRDNELSPNTTLGLHQIVQQVTQRGADYASALHIHAQIVSTGAFAEIGAFMPALKYLLQAAQQLAIHV